MAKGDFTPIVVDGGTDAEIAAAIKLSEQRSQRVAPQVGGSTWSIQGPTVVLRGVFQMRASVPMTKAVRIRGEGAVLDCRRMADEDFVFDGGGWRCELSGGLTLVDAPNGIRWNTGHRLKNLTLGSSLISGVRFSGVRGVAIELQCRSSIVVIDRCVFDKPQKILHSRLCDEVTLRNCFANMATAPGVTPITTQHGRLVIRGGIYTPPPLAREAPGLSWIELTSEGLSKPSREQMVLVDGARFGGEYGGMAVVLNRSAGRTRFPSAPGVCITLRDCHIANTAVSADGQGPAEPSAPVVLLEEMPNHLLIDGCYGMVRPNYLVDFVPSVDGEKLAASYEPVGVNNRCTMQIQRHNTIEIGQEVPSSLRRFLVGPAAANAQQ